MKNKMLPLTDDLAFKYVFSKTEILEDFINSFFSHNGNNNCDNIVINKIIPEAYIMPNSKKYKAYYRDLIIENDELIISLEMYKGIFWERNFNKSLGYLCRLYGNQYTKTKPENFKKVISINLIQGNYANKNPEIVNGYNLRNDLSNLIITNGVSVYLIRYDIANSIPEKDEDRFIKYLKIIGSNSEQEMRKIAKGDSKMLEAIRYWLNWNKSSAKENYELHCEELKDEGRIEGLKEGSEDTKIKIAQSLINKNCSKDFILETTRISEEEFNKLKK